MKGNNKNTRSRRKALRNKMIMVIVAIAIAVTFGVIGTSSLVDAHDSSYTETSVKCYKSIELQEGDTLWGIAEKYMDDSYESIDEYILELKQINNLYTDEIHEGRYLMVAYNQ